MPTRCLRSTAWLISDTSLYLLREEPLELTLEIRREDILAHRIAYLLHGPEPSSVELILRGLDGAAVCCAVNVYQFALALTLKHLPARKEIFVGWAGRKFRLFSLTMQRY